MADMRAMTVIAGRVMTMIAGRVVAVLVPRTVIGNHHVLRSSRLRFRIIGARQFFDTPERHEKSPARVKRRQERREDGNPVNQDVNGAPLVRGQLDGEEDLVLAEEPRQREDPRQGERPTANVVQV